MRLTLLTGKIRDPNATQSNISMLKRIRKGLMPNAHMLGRYEVCEKKGLVTTFGSKWFLTAKGKQALMESR